MTCDGEEAKLLFDGSGSVSDNETFGGGVLWIAGLALLGVSLWAQVFWVPFTSELRLTDSQTLVAAAYLVPLLMLLPAIFVRLPSIRLFLFPIAFLPGLALIPEQELQWFESLWSGVRIGGTLLLYLAVAAFDTNTEKRHGTAKNVGTTSTRNIEGVYPFYAGVRVMCLLALFLLFGWAVYYDPAIAADLNDHHSGSVPQARVFIGIAMLFTWCVIAYTMFFLPITNIEYDVRRLSRSIDETATESRPRWQRMGVWTLVAVLGSVAVILIR